MSIWALMQALTLYGASPREELTRADHSSCVAAKVMAEGPRAVRLHTLAFG